MANCDKVELPHLPTLAEKLGPTPRTPEDPNDESSSHERVDPASRDVEPTGCELTNKEE